MRYLFIIVLIFLGCQNPSPSKYKTLYEKTKAKNSSYSQWQEKKTPLKIIGIIYINPLTTQTKEFKNYTKLLSYIAKHPNYLNLNQKFTSVQFIKKSSDQKFNAVYKNRFEDKEILNDILRNYPDTPSSEIAIMLDYEELQKGNLVIKGYKSVKIKGKKRNSYFFTLKKPEYSKLNKKQKQQALINSIKAVLNLSIPNYISINTQNFIQKEKFKKIYSTKNGVIKKETFFNPIKNALNKLKFKKRMILSNNESVYLLHNFFPQRFSIYKNFAAIQNRKQIVIINLLTGKIIKKIPTDISIHQIKLNENLIIVGYKSSLISSKNFLEVINPKTKETVLKKEIPSLTTALTDKAVYYLDKNKKELNILFLKDFTTKTIKLPQSSYKIFTNDKTIILKGYNQILTLNANTLRVIKSTYIRPTYHFTSLKYSPNLQTKIKITYPNRLTNIQISTPTKKTTISTNNRLLTLAFSKDSKYVALAFNVIKNKIFFSNNFKIDIYDLQSLKKINTLYFEAFKMAFYNHNLVIFSKDTIRILDIRKKPNKTLVSSKDKITFSPNKNYFLLKNTYKKIQFEVYDLNFKKLLSKKLYKKDGYSELLITNKYAVYFYSPWGYSPNKKSLIHFYNLKTKKEKEIWANVASFKVSPCGDDVCLINTKDYQLYKISPNGVKKLSNSLPKKFIVSLKVSPDSQKAVINYFKKTLIYDLKTSKQTLINTKINKSFAITDKFLFYIQKNTLNKLSLTTLKTVKKEINTPVSPKLLADNKHIYITSSIYNKNFTQVFDYNLNLITILPYKIVNSTKNYLISKTGSTLTLINKSFLNVNLKPIDEKIANIKNSFFNKSKKEIKQLIFTTPLNPKDLLVLKTTNYITSFKTTLRAKEVEKIADILGVDFLDPLLAYNVSFLKKYALKVVKYSNTYETILKPFYDINEIFFNSPFDYKKAGFQRR
ncbi:MAG: hypothetical protein ABGX26_03845 [Nautiliaceae bacterium]